MVELGDTLSVINDAAVFTGVKTPVELSLILPTKGPVPVKSTRITVELPLQIVSFPVMDMVAFGTGRTTIFLVPVTVPGHASLTLNNVYVVVAAGETFIETGFEAVVAVISGPVLLLTTYCQGPVPVNESDMVEPPPLQMVSFAVFTTLAVGNALIVAFALPLTVPAHAPITELSV